MMASPMYLGMMWQGWYKPPETNTSLCISTVLACGPSTKQANVQSKMCNKSTPVFEQLTTFIEPKSLILMKCDLEEYRVPFEIYQLPTIKLFPGPKSMRKYPVEYFGVASSLKGYLRFLRQEDNSFLKVIRTP